MLETCRIDTRQNILIDPDNVFWAMSGFINLYQRKKPNLDKELGEFRFSANLSAVYIDPTDRCNANCPYCYIPGRIRRDGVAMDNEQLFYILNKIKTHFKEQKKKPVIVFHAAEPLLAKEIVFKAIKEFSDRFHFGLQTNALLLEKPDTEFLKKYRVGVGISLDSFSAPLNNRLRPAYPSGGNFAKAVKAIEWFDGYEGMNVITTITKLNVSGLSDLVKFLHAKRVPCVLLNPVRLTQKNSRSLKPDEKILTKYFIRAVDTAIELSRHSKRRIIIGNFANVILGIVAPTARRLMCDISPCGGGRCFLTITASGEMIPCGEFIGLKGFSGGNIFKTGIKQAMQSAPFRKIRARIVEKITDCKACVFRNICGAPCPAELYSRGNMYRPSLFCGFYKEIIKYAFKLIAEKKEKYCFRESSLNNLEYEYRL